MPVVLIEKENIGIVCKTKDLRSTFLIKGYLDFELEDNLECMILFVRSKVYTECKYGGSLGRPGSTCAKARLVRPRVCFDNASFEVFAL